MLGIRFLSMMKMIVDVLQKDDEIVSIEKLVFWKFHMG